MAERAKDTHVLERTSPMGGPFLGTCILCGSKGLTMRQANEPCMNPAMVSERDALIAAIEGDDVDEPSEGET